MSQISSLSLETPAPQGASATGRLPVDTSSKHRRTTIYLVIGYGILRVALALSPGYSIDLQWYGEWALAAATHGLAEVYAQSSMDYPPLYAYILYPIGLICRWAGIGAADLTDSTLFILLVKTPPILFDLLIAGLLVLWLRRQPSIRDDAWARALPWLYLMNPAVLMGSAYWGQPDAIHSGLVLAAFLWLGWARQAWPSWVLLAMATLMKPLGAPFIPLLAVLSLLRHGFRSTVFGGLAGLLTAGLAFLPFLFSGRLVATVRRVVLDVGTTPLTSTNGHNLWWLLGPWQDSNAPWLGAITPTQIALGLFGVFYLGVLWTAWGLHRENRSGSGTASVSPPQVLGLAFLVGTGFFMLSTQMHENHLFVALPLLLPLTVISGGAQRWTRGIYLAVSIGFFLNLLLHDLRFVETPLMTVAGELSVAHPAYPADVARPYYAVEYLAIQFSMIWNLALFAYLLVNTFRVGGGWLSGRVGLPLRSKRADRTRAPRQVWSPAVVRRTGGLVRGPWVI